MPLMIARPCTLQPTLIPRLQYPCQVPLLRGQPLFLPTFTSIVRSIMSTLLPALAHDKRRLLILLLVRLTVSITGVINDVLLWLDVIWQMLMISERTLVQSLDMVKSSVLADWVRTGL